MANDLFEFEHDYNYGENQLRDITLGVINQLYRKLRWTYTWQDKKKQVTVPFFYSLTGSDDFLLDAFVDNIPGKRPELNIDQVPRGTLVLESFQIITAEITNPNVNLVAYREIDGIIKKVIGKFRILPIKCTYNIVIKLDNENDIQKCQMALWSLFQQTSYQFFYNDWRSFRIDSVMSIPESKPFEFSRDITNTSEDKKEIKFQIDVKSFHPVEPVESPLIPINQKIKVVKGRMWNLNSITTTPVYVGVKKNLTNKDYKNPI